MRKKTKRNLQMACAVAMPIGAIGFLGWACVESAEIAPVKVERIRVSFVEPVAVPESPSAIDLNKRLQGPAPVRNTQAERKSVAPPFSWPPIKLECVFATSESSLAVINFNNKKHRCEVGDQVGSVIVDQILEDAIVVSSRGQVKTIKIDGKLSGQ